MRDFLKGNTVAIIALAVATLVAALAAVAGAGGTQAAAFLGAPYNQADVAVLAKGVVWADQTRVIYQGFRSPSRVLGGLESTEPLLSSSGQAIVVAGRGTREGLSGAVLPNRLTPIDQIWEEVHGGGCTWLPSQGGDEGELVVIVEQVIDTASCGEETVPQGLAMQPLFVRNVRAGEWRVLRWLKGHRSPALAAEGNLLAVGDPSSTRRMHVTIFDFPRARPVAQFDAPAGSISFASSRRLVISAPVPRSSQESVRRTLAAIEPLLRLRLSYRAELYSLTGRRLSDLGTFGQPPLVSHMHALFQESVEGGSVLVVRSLPGGPSRRLIGFDDPARMLDGVAFRWPAVALVERTSTPLQQSEVTCDSGDYHQPGPPSLAILDLARAEPFVPAPPPVQLAPPPGKCPPRPIHARDSDMWAHGP